jgi:hypothetical protein
MDIVHSRAEDEDETSTLTNNNNKYSQLLHDNILDDDREGESPRISFQEDIEYK